MDIQALRGWFAIQLASIQCVPRVSLAPLLLEGLGEASHFVLSIEIHYEFTRTGTAKVEVCTAGIHMTTGCRPVQRVVFAYEQDALVLGIPDDGAVRALEGAASKVCVVHRVVDGDTSEYRTDKVCSWSFLGGPLDDEWCTSRDGFRLCRCQD